MIYKMKFHTMKNDEDYLQKFLHLKKIRLRHRIAS